MSVPLDRLYNFLHDVCNHDVIIYRYFPHGSKNIKHCAPIDDRSWYEFMTIPHAWHHDQECLDIDLIPLSSMYIKDNDKFVKAKHPHVWFKNQTPVSYQLFNKIILVHSEWNSDCVDTLKNHGYIPVHWLSHALIARDWYRYAKHDPLLDHAQRKIEKKFLVYNRAWTGSREYRIKFAELLVNHGILNQCKTSFGFVDNGVHYSDHLFNNKALSVTTLLENYFESNSADAASSADYESRDYQTTAVEVVLETVFDDTKNHLTEKTFRPIATGTPFMILGTPGSLTYLKRYGFETFSPWICEDYDLETDPLLRMQMIIDEMQRLDSLSDQDFAKVITQCRSIAARNRIRFFSSDFYTQVINEYREGMNQAIELCKQDLSLEAWDLFCEKNPVPGDIVAVKKYFNLT